MADSSLQPSRCCKPKVKAQQFRVLQSLERPRADDAEWLLQTQLAKIRA
jgi:hypothetical protein